VTATFDKLKITLFVPVRNEIDALKIIMPRIKKEWCDEILILDGHSTDGSKEFLLSNGFAVVDQTTTGVKADAMKVTTFLGPQKLSTDIINAFTSRGGVPNMRLKSVALL
jgi:hypothetical protein